MNTLQSCVAHVAELDVQAMNAARARHAQLTKPQGSLGRLEELAIQVAGITGQSRPRLERKAIVVCAGDHGVVAEGVSAFPQEVTAQMVLNFLRGGAAINVLARHVDARVVVMDVGVAADLPPHADLRVRKIGHGTANIALGPAMTRAQAEQSIEVGIATIEEEIARGLDIVGTGDMGIGNTTPASAIVATFTDLSAARVTGRGTGVDDAGLARKVATVERALEINRPNPTDPLDVLSKVGGFEIGAIAGLVLGAAAHRIPVVVDGFISTAGALIATELCPAARDYCIAAHRSVEIGHQAMLAHIGLNPLLDLNMRLGEGTGAALAISLVEAACRVLDEMATFAEAEVSDKA